MENQDTFYKPRPIKLYYQDLPPNATFQDKLKRAEEMAGYVKNKNEAEERLEDIYQELYHGGFLPEAKAVLSHEADIICKKFNLPTPDWFSIGLNPAEDDSIEEESGQAESE